MRALLLTLALAACASAPTGQSSIEDEATYCNAPLYIACLPGRIENCASKCGNNLAYCPEYNPIEIAHCLHGNGIGACVTTDMSSPLWQACDQWGTPCWTHNCIIGDPAVLEHAE